ncbi:MAG: putative molybdenum carrier protein [Proteobacteria bacterium]|nr:putative molybdenum carrier protein [Pseudomonadota bacterium]MBU1543958.1 putative molybdenum carrier protein [Pseudomonadota bacterium]MBU2479933.1 putative molybdenum carrier protein [Pseudomonadota bacterium]
MLEKIVSGGQTGADIAGVDAAIFCRFPYGGWLPQGRKSEKGLVPEKYNQFQVMARGGYPKRTEQNVIESDGTVIFTFGKLSGGSLLTKKLAVKNNKPWLHIDLDMIKNPSAKIIDWLIEWDIKRLNVAGKSASKAPGIYKQVKAIMTDILQQEY